MSERTPLELFKYLDDAIEDVEERGFTDMRIQKGTLGHDALGLAHAVSHLIDFGGGLLKLQDGTRFKLLRPCKACEVAAPTMIPQ
jgi:hypothetical protein